MPIMHGDQVYGHAIFCPGCKTTHIFDHRWHFNGDLVRPTFGPTPTSRSYSMLVNQSDPRTRCHSFVTDGRIRFLNDCWHELRGQTVDLEDFTEPHAPGTAAPETEQAELLRSADGEAGAQTNTQTEGATTMTGKCRIDEIHQRTGSRLNDKNEHTQDNQLRLLVSAVHPKDKDRSPWAGIKGEIFVSTSDPKAFSVGDECTVSINVTGNPIKEAAEKAAKDAEEKKAAKADLLAKETAEKAAAKPAPNAGDQGGGQ